MGGVQEVDALGNFNLTLDQFYSLVKAQAGNLAVNQYLQLQATAIPLDVSPSYPWFSYANLVRSFDISIAPEPVSNTLSKADPIKLQLMDQRRLSKEFGNFLATALSLIEIKALSKETLDRIDQLKVEIDNVSIQVDKILQSRLQAWSTYCAGTFTLPGDLTAFTHWSQGQASSTELTNLVNLQSQKQALITALRQTEYASPDDQAIATAYAQYTSPASRMRYPRYPDTQYSNSSEFNPVYFAHLSDNDSDLFTNNYTMTPALAISTITTSPLGHFANAVTKESRANSSVTTDWNASGSVGYGMFSLKANVSSHESIKKDFSAVQSVTVGTRSLLAIAFDARPWFDPTLFNNGVVLRNRKAFERYLGVNGTLLYYPTHLIVARGLNLTFHSSQNWEYDYARDFSTSGSASCSVFGISFGGGGGYSESRREQQIEKRGHDLTLDDGETSLRILGYNVVKNVGFGEAITAAYGAQIQTMNAFFE